MSVFSQWWFVWTHLHSCTIWWDKVNLIIFMSNLQVDQSICCLLLVVCNAICTNILRLVWLSYSSMNKTTTPPVVKGKTEINYIQLLWSIPIYIFCSSVTILSFFKHLLIIIIEAVVHNYRKSLYVSFYIHTWTYLFICSILFRYVLIIMLCSWIVNIDLIQGYHQLTYDI